MQVLKFRGPPSFKDQVRRTTGRLLEDRWKRRGEYRYKIDRGLGSGGHAVVHRAHHAWEKGAPHVAIKQLKPRYQMEQPEILVCEALALERVRHENIVRWIDGPNVDEYGQFYFAMELLEGKLLEEVLKRGTFPWWVAVEISIGVCRAAGAMHAQGLIHRDIKPDNVFLVPNPKGNPRIKIFDLGLAVEIGHEEWDFMPGTPGHMSPEQIRGTVLKEMSDVYAAGLLLFGMLTGRNPFPGRDAREVCEMNLWAPPPYPRLVRPDLDIPESVENVVMRAL